jgi:5-deoxy-glucuronate isomerase
VIAVETPNARAFPVRRIEPRGVRSEERGQGKLEGTAHRIVRTAFDGTDSAAESELVVGEVVCLPGRWSSYPPHHHPQPELYYYRFSPPQGYGHAECGEDVYKVREHDVLRIPPGQVHAQCAAPGYHMYYLWTIRHLPQERYWGFTYEAAHGWTFA